MEPNLLKFAGAGDEGFFFWNKPFLDQLRLRTSKWQQFVEPHLRQELSARQYSPTVYKFFQTWNERAHSASFIVEAGNEKRFYIPILRGMRPLQGGESNEYRTRTITDYFGVNHEMQKDGREWEVFTGLELFKDLRRQLLGEPHDREAIRKFENFLKSTFFDGKEVTLIPREGKDVVHIKIGTEAQFPIYQLGDGLQNLIIITYPIFMNDKRCLFFIEEPDLSMHPGMQRALLEQMTRHDRHQYFLTTHSNHLLDMSSEFKEMSVYLFTKEFKDDNARFKVMQATSPDRNILKELGVHNSSVFLTNATLWVEGITDRLYLKAYLKRFLRTKTRTIREDYHYSFVEYQGSNLTHWAFEDTEESRKINASHLCGHSFLIADGDIVNKGTRKQDCERKLGKRFYPLDCKEIENLVPAEILKAVVEERFKKHGKAMPIIEYAAYSTSAQGIGEYLDKLWGSNEFATETGTLKVKVNFCERAVEIMNDSQFPWQLTDPLRNLCERIYDFVIEQNHLK